MVGFDSLWENDLTGITRRDLTQNDVEEETLCPRTEYICG